MCLLVVSDMVVWYIRQYELPKHNWWSAGSGGLYETRRQQVLLKRKDLHVRQSYLREVIQYRI